MADSKKQHLSPFDRLVRDIVQDFKLGGPKHDNYRQRRIDLIDATGNSGLHGVDQLLLTTLEQLDPKKYKVNPEVHQRMKGWARVLLNRTGPVESHS